MAEGHPMEWPDGPQLVEKVKEAFKKFLENDKTLVDRVLMANVGAFSDLIDNSEDVLTKLIEVKNQFNKWVSLGSVDMEEGIQLHLKTTKDWRLNFAVSKAKGQEIQQLAMDDQEVGVFRLSFKLLRFEIEFLNQKFWDILITHLQNTIMYKQIEVEKAVRAATETLMYKPQTVEEITDAKLAKEELMRQMPQIESLYQDINEKTKILQDWAKIIADTMRIQEKFENFTTLLKNHDTTLSQQITVVVANTENATLRLKDETERFKIQWDEFKPRDEDGHIMSENFEKHTKYIDLKKTEWAKLLNQKQRLISACEKLNMPMPEFELANEIDADISERVDLWNKLEEFNKEFKEYANEDWIIFRTRAFRFDEMLAKWEAVFRNEFKSNFVVSCLKQIEEHKLLVPNTKFIRGESFAEKHWYEMFQLIGIPTKSLSMLKVNDFIQPHIIENIIAKQDELKELNARVAGEQIIRQGLNELDAWEVEAKFTLAENMDSKNRVVYVVEDFKSILSKVGDHQSLLQSMKTSPFYTHFLDRISVWETRLTDLDEYLTKLSRTQRRWIYLEPIFTHGVLENEAVRFKRIDDEFRAITAAIAQDPRVISLVKIPQIRSTLIMLLSQLSRCQNSLNEFLEKKRSGFPRFYFIGDDDLLEILGQSTKPTVIQSHLKKLFAGIYSVGFDDNNEYILSMASVEGEVVPLKSKVKISVNVEEWLSELSNEMKYTLKSFLLECISESKTEKMDPRKYPAQILGLCTCTLFTEKCEEAIRSTQLDQLGQQLKEELRSYTTDESPKSEVTQLKLKDLILDVIHHIDVVDILIKERVSSVSNWWWQKQLRFYIREDGTAVIKMADAEFEYSYEYQGNAQKLVYTPLLDKCFLTLTQGMRMGLGGNPYGPAGTGKTESVKALGIYLGRLVLVFNCDEGIDVKAIGRIFIGLAKCGAWGCFDEFNRLDGATLSAVSVLIHPIQTALKSGLDKVGLMEDVIPLNPHAGIFVTLNPAGKGYGGRNNLPDNLKQLFRPVAMTHPNMDIIASVLLLTDGFKYAQKMGKKLVEVFITARSTLTPQTHYDWGLRALKTILNGCGTALRANNGLIPNMSEQEEAHIVVGALRLNTCPKLTYGDLFRFDDLIKDVFSGVVFKDLGFEKLVEHLRASCETLNLRVNENQIRKCVELYEQLSQRMGVVIVGPPSCGKSTVLTLLKTALLAMDENIKTHIISPKSMSKSQLLGHINLDTRQWTDGVLTLKAQQVYAEPDDINSWIILDGDIDPEWIESLNSVLDDNHLLTLPSGWRIKFGMNVNFVFETHDLSFASPATISRMGMIFLSDEDSDVEGVVSSWMEKEDESTKGLSEYISSHFFNGVDWVCQRPHPIIALSRISVAKNALSQMHGIKSLAELTAAMIHGLSGHLKKDDRIELANLVMGWTGENLGVEIATEDVLNVCYNPRTRGLDLYQDNILDDNAYEIRGSRFPLVQTASVRQILGQIKAWLQSGDPFILVGPEGCGKTMILEYAFEEMRSAEVATIYCSSLTSPEQVLQKLSQICITNTTATGRVYKPKSGDRLILYFKDINLIKPDKWGTCQLVQLLQQMLTYQGFYDNSLEWVGIKGIQIVATLTEGNSAGKYALSPRFTAITRLYTVIEPRQEELNTIYKKYLSLYMKKFHPNNSVTSNNSQLNGLATALVSFFVTLKSTFTPVQQMHYVFTPRDLTNWVAGMMRYDLETVDKNNFEDLILVWAYEGCRLFRDKLVSIADKTKFDQLLGSVLRDQLNVTDVETRLEDTYFISAKSRASIGLTGNTTESGLIKTESSELMSIAQHGLAKFNREQREMKVVLFKEVLENLAHFDRVLSAPYSSMVLAGRAGIGRRTALSIVSSLHIASICTLKVGRNYTVKQFKADLKTAIQTSAVEGGKIYFVVEDFQLVDDVFLDMLNSLLSSGEVPGLYTPEELDAIIAPLRETAAAEGYNSSLTSYFAERVREMMHLILIMDYTNQDFKKKCESNPAIYKRCSMVWLSIWSQDTLRILPELIIKSFYSSGSGTDLISQDVGEDKEFFDGFKRIYNSLDLTLASPRRYFAFINSYGSLMRRRKTFTVRQMNNYKAGVSKLEEAWTVVNKLREEAGTQEVVLAEKQRNVNSALEEISRTMSSSSLQRNEIQKLQEAAQIETENLRIRKLEIDVELEEVQPMVLEAKNAVRGIGSAHLTELKNLRVPPKTIVDIMEGVLKLLGMHDLSWTAMKNTIMRKEVRDMIIEFDARDLQDAELKSCQTKMGETPSSFLPENAKRACMAALPLAVWVNANVKYAEVLRKIKPLELQQAQLKKTLGTTEANLADLNEGLIEVNERVQFLKEELSRNTLEAAQLEIKMAETTKTLKAAEGLVGKLQDEFVRWQEQLRVLEKKLEVLPTNCRYGSAFMTYLSDGTEDTRREYMEKWQALLGKEGGSEFSFSEFMSSEKERAGFDRHGLPDDKLSRENGIIMYETDLRPYMIDPEDRATAWLKSTVGGHVTISMHDPKFATELEMAIRFGKAMIISDVDELEPILIPILRGDVIAEGSRSIIQFGDKYVEYNPEFRLFLCTRNPNPNLSPDTAAAVTAINFTTTHEGLTKDLLSKTLAIVKPELEQRKRDLFSGMAIMQEQLSELGDCILEDLGNATGDILNNEELLNSLTECKIKSEAIKASLAESAIVQDEIAREFALYSSYAEYGSHLFFVVTDVAKLSNMYSISQSTFTHIFTDILRNRENTEPPEEGQRMFELERQLKNAVYEHVCRSLFKKDRLAFALHLIKGMETFGNEPCEKNEWEAFTGLLLVEQSRSSASLGDSIPKWLDEDRTFSINLLKSEFPALYQKLSFNQSNWPALYKDPEFDKTLPTVITGLSDFQVLLVVQTLRPDRLHSAMMRFAKHQLGRKPLFPAPVNLRDIHKSTLPKDFILIITSPGADPSQELRELAEKTLGPNHYVEIAMGHGTIDDVIKKLKEASAEGSWVCLTNLHLVIHWMKNLEIELHNLVITNDDFRLWLTTEPHDAFPAAMANKYIKIAYEAPQGLKKNLQSTYSNWSEKFIEGNGNVLRSQTFFCLAFFHALAQERRTFIPQGWTKFYEYNDSDLRAGVEVIENTFSAKTKEIQWPYIRGIFENAIYGGRVDNNYDNRVLVSYLLNYFHAKAVPDFQQRFKSIKLLIPGTSNYQDYLDTIESIPDTDKPAYFGLPSNIDRSWQRTVSAGVIAQLKTLSQKFSGDDVIHDVNIWSAELSPLISFWKRITQRNEILNLLTGKIPQPDVPDKPIDPIEGFIMLEHYNAHSFIQVLHKDLGAINQVARQGKIPTAEAVRIANALLRRETPQEWLKIWDGPTDSQEYLQGAVQRFVALRMWVSKVGSGNLFLRPVNLSDLFNPESFLNAFKQQCARKLNTAMDELGFVCAWNEESIPRDCVTCKLTGILLEGCAFDGVNFLEHKEESSPIVKLPDCTIAWIPQTKIPPRSPGSILSVPLYYNETRQKLIGSLEFPSKGNNEKWIQAGIGLFLSA